jgi:hypothetical protein
MHIRRHSCTKGFHVPEPSEPKQACPEDDIGNVVGSSGCNLFELAEPEGQHKGTDTRGGMHHHTTRKVNGSVLEEPTIGEEEVVCQRAIDEDMPHQDKHHEPDVLHLLYNGA